MSSILCWCEFASILHYLTGSASEAVGAELGIESLIFNLKYTTMTKEDLILKWQKEMELFKISKPYAPGLTESNMNQIAQDTISLFLNDLKNLNEETVKREHLIGFAQYMRERKIATLFNNNESMVDGYLSQLNE
jgi:hypothetical protein